MTAKRIHPNHDTEESRARDARLRELVRQSCEQFNAMSPEEQQRHLEAQRQSWVHGEMAMGSDADEATWREVNMSKKEPGND